MHNSWKDKRHIALGTSRGLNWENKSYKLKRSILKWSLVLDCLFTISSTKYIAVRTCWFAKCTCGNEDRTSLPSFHTTVSNFANIIGTKESFCKRIRFNSGSRLVWNYTGSPIWRAWRHVNTLHIFCRVCLAWLMKRLLCISHNTPCLPPKILHKYCLQFLLARL